MDRSSERNGDQKPLVLCPVHAGFIPPYPRTPAAIYGDRGMRLEFWARRQRLQWGELAALIGPELYVLIPLVVGAPWDVGGAVWSCGHRRFPIVGRRFAHAHFSGPGPLREGAQENVALSVAKTLPSEENLTVGRRRR